MWLMFAIHWMPTLRKDLNINGEALFKAVGLKGCKDKFKFHFDR